MLTLQNSITAIHDAVSQAMTDALAAVNHLMVLPASSQPTLPSAYPPVQESREHYR